MPAPPACCNVTPEQELRILQLILSLRSFGDEASSERLRRKVRCCLLESADDDEAVATTDVLLRRFTKILKKLDGSYEKEREMRLKRRLEEEGTRVTSRYVDDEAESGDEEEEEEMEEEEEQEEGEE